MACHLVAPIISPFASAAGRAGLPQARAHHSMTAPSPAQAPEAASARQQEMPLALVQGQPVLQLPQDLYIPPDALEVILEAFEGPLDLLLYLIRRQNLDILDIPVAEITRQYVAYIEVMHELRFELAAEYLVMAAILAEIKSRMLLPRPPGDAETGEDDPRAELVRRLQEYERFRQAADDIDRLPRMERDTSVVQVDTADRSHLREPPAVELRELLLALADVLRRADLNAEVAIHRDALSVRQRMGDLLERLGDGQFHRFESLFDANEGRMGVVVTFLAMLELTKEWLLDIVQDAPLAPIYLQSRATAGDDDTTPTETDGGARDDDDDNAEAVYDTAEDATAGAPPADAAPDAIA
jgi:segregation and condensation protein A